jgi:hypothetical protein
VLTAAVGVATAAVLGVGLTDVAGLAGVTARGAQAAAPDSPFTGRLAKALFLTEDVAKALADVAATGPAASRSMVTEAAARARQPEPALAAPAGSNPIAASRLARRRVLAQGMVALVGTPEARAESIAASEALLPVEPSPVEDAQGIGVHLGLAERGETYLKAHRESAVTPYLYAYLMVQYRLAFERQVSAKAVEGQKASAKKYRTFRQRALASTEPLVKAVAEDIDAQLYLERPTPEHPGNFDPDACCRDK